MTDTELTLKKAIELNQLDKFAAQQEVWLREKGYDFRPESETDGVLDSLIKPLRSEGQT